MHWLDILILVVLGVGAAMGFWSGLLWQVARVVSLAVSLYVAILSNSGAASWLGEQWKDLNPAVNRVIAFIAIFLAVYLALYFLTRVLHGIIKATKLETLDRVLGALLGIIKMGAIVACVCAVMVALDLQVFKDWFSEATLAPHFARGTQVAVAWVPQHYRDRLDEGVQEVRDQVQQKLADAAMDALKGEVQKNNHR
jgi:membrane protein required for colicin V production